MALEDYSPILDRFRWHLKMNHVSRGRSREWLFVMLHHHGPCDMQKLRDLACAHMSGSGAYRNLKLFLSLGVAQQVRPGLYELTDRFKQHGHGMWCRVCGRRAGFWDEQLERVIERVVLKRNFALEEHQVELMGICPKCLLNPANQPREAIGLKLRRLPAGGYRNRRLASPIREED